MILLKIKVKICSILARLPITQMWPTFWWRKCGYNIGKNSRIGPYCLIWADHSTDQDLVFIEDYVYIAPNVTLTVISHPKEDMVKFGKMVSTTKRKIIIKRGCWIGAGVTILSGITINECAIVGAGAVVTKNVEPYTIVAGVPAKKIGVLD